MAEPNNKEASTSPNWPELFNTLFEGWVNSPTVRQIWRRVYGENYPEEADPMSSVTLTDLRRIAQDIHVGPSQTFVDLGCGCGGPGLWVARETGANLEMGEAAARPLLDEATLLPGLSDGTDSLSHMRRILVVARRS